MKDIMKYFFLFRRWWKWWGQWECPTEIRAKSHDYLAEPHPLSPKPRPLKALQLLTQTAFERYQDMIERTTYYSALLFFCPPYRRSQRELKGLKSKYSSNIKKCHFGHTILILHFYFTCFGVNWPLNWLLSSVPYFVFSVFGQCFIFFSWLMNQSS